MKVAVRILVLVTFVVATSITARASSIPVIQGHVFGLELCPQSLCGAAVFTAIFKGRIGFNPFALGTITAALNHGPLPVVEDDCTPISGGDWILLAGFRRIVGTATGELCYNGDNTFHIDVALQLTEGGTGLAHFGGILDHNVFPPTAIGRIVQ